MPLKNWFKSKPYWLKVTIILALTVWIYFFLWQVLTGRCSALVIEKACSISEALILPTILLIPSFIIGVIIGLIVEKIRAKK